MSNLNTDGGNQGQGANIAAVVSIGTLAFTVISPLSLVTAIVFWGLYQFGRIRPKVLAAFTGLYALIVGIMTLIGIPVIAWYAQSLNGLFLAATKELEFTSQFVLQVLGRQLPLSILIGALLGTILVAVRHKVHPKWDEDELAETPWRRIKRKRNTKLLRNGKYQSKVGSVFGINDETGDIAIQSDKEAAAHTFVVGASGTGKTQGMATLGQGYIARGHGMIIIDNKGGADIPKIFYDYAQEAGVGFYHWVICKDKASYTGPDPDGPASWDALARGDASRRRDMVLSLREWSEAHYENIVSSYLQTAFNVILATPEYASHEDTLTQIMNICNIDSLRLRADKLPKGMEYEPLRREVRSFTQGKVDPAMKSAVAGMGSIIQNLSSGSAGNWLHAPQDENGKEIVLSDIARRGDIVVFSLDTSNYEKTAPIIANLIVQDLKTVTSELRVNPQKHPTHIFIDEFSAMNSVGIQGLINKARDAKMPILLSTQALGDLRLKNPAFMDQLIGTINAFIIHRANALSDAETLAGIAGRAKTLKQSHRVVDGGDMDSSTSGTIQEVVDYAVSPEAIMELKLGEMFYIAKSPVQRREKIIIIPDEKHLTGAQRYKKNTPEPKEQEQWDDSNTEVEVEIEPTPVTRKKPLKPVSSVIEEEVQEEEYFAPTFEIKPSKTDFMNNGRRPLEVTQKPATQPLPSTSKLPPRKPLPNMTPPPSRPGGLPSRPAGSTGSLPLPPVRNKPTKADELPSTPEVRKTLPIPPGGVKRPTPPPVRKPSVAPTKQGKTGDGWF